MVDDLYQEIIIDHSKRPRNCHAMEDANRRAEGYNPLCGDKLKLFLKMEGDVVRDLSFVGAGCAISTASASLIPSSAAYLRTSSVIFMLQKCGPHMLQKWAVLAPSAGNVSSWYSRAVSGSRLRLNWSSQRNSNRALLSALSRSCAPGWPFARSAACAAILYAMTPSLTSF